MTILDPYYIDIDGEAMATYAKAIEVIDGIENVPGRRISEKQAAYVDGSYPTLDVDSFFTHKQQRLRIWIAPFDADGNVTHANGSRAHLRENLEGVFRLLGGKAKSNHVVTWRVPTPTGTKQLRNNARITVPTNVLGGTRLVRRLDIFLTYPWPFWRDITTGQQTVGPFTGAQSITPGGTAPMIDAIYTCTAAGRITHDESGHFHEVTSIPGGATSVIINQRPPRTIKTNTGADARAFYNSDWGGGLRLDAGTLANFTITGTWQIDYYNSEH